MTPTPEQLAEWRMLAEDFFSVREDRRTIPDAFDLAGAVPALIALVKSQAEELERVAAVLEPFAALAEDYINHGLADDDAVMAGRVRGRSDDVPPRILFSHFRAARDLHAELGGKG